MGRVKNNLYSIVTKGGRISWSPRFSVIKETEGAPFNNRLVVGLFETGKMATLSELTPLISEWEGKVWKDGTTGKKEK